jgi:hypothetical protein
VQMVHANPREIGHLVIGEDLLARFDGNHGPGPLSLRLPSTPLDAYGILRAALSKSNSRSVSHAKNESASTSRLKSRDCAPFLTFASNGTS